MRTRLLLLLMPMLLLLPAGPTRSAQADAEAVATLPLDELIELYRERDAKEEKRDPEPPVAASVTGLQLKGRLLDEALDVRAQVDLAVLARDRWVSVPLLRKGPATQLVELPEVQHGTFVVDQGWLRFVTRRAGRYRFELAWLEQAVVEGDLRRVTLDPAAAAQTSLVVAYDPGLFRLENGGLERPEGVAILPSDGQLAVGWRRVAKPPVAKREAERGPGVVPVVVLAHASSVSTLEGRRLTRLLYELRFAGRPSIRLRIPDGQRLERAYRNGVAFHPELQGDTLDVEVRPVRAGEERGTLELVVVAAQERFHLSGSLAFELPAASWPVNELYLDLHLPQVFDYAWLGGSLSPVDTSPAAEFSHGLPLPGRRLSFHQYLIGSQSPDVTLDYTVNLDGHSFAP